MKEVFVDIERCTACKACEIACGVEHSSSKSLYGAIFERPVPQKRVHVEPAFAYAYPVRCLHCGDAPCIAACPNGAMGRDEATGSVIVDEARCQGCFMCAMVCPFGAISAHSAKRTAVKCDRCVDRLKIGLVPACVDACPTHALEFGEEEDLVSEKRLSTAARVAKAVSGATAARESAPTPLDTLRSLRGC
jgi:anaerobic carbon-monoxide dehydrogenase iron sulfur subunit